MITVLGDVMVDEYWPLIDLGPNPERSPGRKFAVGRVTQRILGGAGVVARQIRAAGVAVTLAGRIGHDPSGTWAVEACRLEGISDELVREQSLRTVRKVRMLHRGQICPDRIDLDDARAMTASTRAQLANCPLGDVLVVSDYGKGACPLDLIKSVFTRAKRVRAAILVDPAQGRSWDDYAGCRLVKANRNEAQAQLGRRSTPRQMAKRLAERYGVAVVVTAGEDGCGYCDPVTQCCGAVRSLPALDPVDVCGCGDTVMSVLALGVGWGWDLEQSCREAMRVAGQQVRHRGADTLRDEFAALAARHLAPIPS